MRLTSLGNMTLLAALAGLSAVSFMTDPSSIAASEGLTGPELLRALQRGGFVIYFRHAATDHEQQDGNPVELHRCVTQRNLSEAGRRQAREIGEVFAALRIRVDRVLTSPYCRCVETANLAFGTYQKLDTLTYFLGVPPSERPPLSAHLRQLLATVPAPGTNIVLVSHNINLKDVADVWPREEGDAHVFLPHGTGRFEHVAEASAARWREWGRAMGALP